MFLDFNNFESDTTPDFTGERVHSYLKLKNISRRVQELRKTFVPSSTNDTYFDQCPDSFNKHKLKQFGKRLESKSAEALIKV